MTNDIDLKLSKCDLNPGHEYTAVSNNAIFELKPDIAILTTNINTPPTSTDESYDNVLPKYLTQQAQDNNKYSDLCLEKSSCNDECCNSCTRNNASAQWYDNARKKYTQAVQDTRNETLCGDTNVQYPAIYKQSGYTSSPFNIYFDSLTRKDLKHCNTFGPTPKYVIPNNPKDVIQECVNSSGVVVSKIVTKKNKARDYGCPYSVIAGKSKYSRNPGFAISRTRNLNFSATL